MADQKISALTSATTPLAGTEVLPIVQSSTTVKVAVSNLTAGRAVSVGSLDSAGDAVVGTTNTGLTQLSLTTTGEAADQKTWRFQTGTGIGAGILRLRALNDAATSGQNAWLLNRTAENIDSQNFLTGGSNRLSIGATDVTVNTGNLVIGTSGKGIDFSATSGSGTSELLADYEEGTWTPTQGAGLTVVGSFSSNGTYTKVGRLVTIRGKVDGSTSVECSSAGIICGGLPYAVATDTAGVYFNGTLSAGGSVDANSSNVNAVGAIAATVSIYFSATYQV